MNQPQGLSTQQIRKVAGYALLFPACTLFLLYLFRPRPHVLAAVTSWVAAGAMLLALSTSPKLDDLVQSLTHLCEQRIRQLPERVQIGRAHV